MSTRLDHSAGVRHSRPGYVLVLTLVVLALAASAMVGLSRAAMLQSLSARRAEERLQRRWGTLTCTATLLPNVEKILAREEADLGRPAGAKQATIVLGRQTFDLVVADEQAKLDANALVYYRGRAAAEAAVRKVLREDKVARLRVRFLAGSTRPLAPSITGDTPDGDEDADRTDDDPEGELERPDYRPIQSFGQMFADELPGELAGAGITCWGDGAVRLRRASPTALAEICAPVLDASKVRRLVEIRDRFPGIAVTRALDALQLDADARDEVESRLADESSCHSLWVIARGPERSWYHFAVSDGSRPQDALESFEW